MEIDPSGEPYDCDEITPYEEWSAGQRVDMLQHVPGLFKDAVDQVRLFIVRTQEDVG